jgi:predicted ester cyclase
MEISLPGSTLARRFFAEQDRLRGGPAEELCAPGYTAHLAGSSYDLPGHRAFAAAFYQAFPDLRHHVELAVAEGDHVAVRFTLRGTHSGPFAGLEATGRAIRVGASAIMRLEGRRVAEVWGEFDQLALMGQLRGEVAVAAEGGI